MASSNEPGARVPDPAPLLKPTELADTEPIRAILLDTALDGVRIQSVLRVLLAVFALGAITLEPPARSGIWCLVIAAVYLVWCVVGVVLLPHGGWLAIRFAWTALFIDMAALTLLTLIASESDQISWTADILVNGFFLLPMIAAISLRPALCAVVMVPTVITYFVGSVLAKDPNGEPWTIIGLRTGVIGALALGAVWLSRLQRTRVVMIGSLAAQRSRLLDDIMEIEARERRQLAEHLHDGALQYVLAARQELPALTPDPPNSDRTAAARIDEALRESARLLRSTLAELHPAVLERSGLAAALTDLTTSVAHRTSLTIAVDTAGWPASAATTVDAILFTTARELLTNIVKHARATHVEATIEFGPRARLVVVDDGMGFDDTMLDHRVTDGHIGLLSRRVRLESRGGTLTIRRRPAGGTVVVAEIPTDPADPARTA
ncbi:histidine kinase [Gordonia sp. ABSL1-1]|uniref:sensor histidine kinase n=1 Tax=Gordonia sp. ABSL1-1 TaxID=3053923 RepID=UPI002572ED4E|nr:ATP-binding protein [Gordonia sp. ABSL1-1]MDL9935399.1 histidine kinase [Gordonia sp. ABSL1-1]